MAGESRPSPATARAIGFVAEHRLAAETLGARLAELVNDPDRFADALGAGFRSLADPEYETGQRRIAPGIGPVLGVRWPLMAAVTRGFRAATRGEPPAPLLFVADRLLRELHAEPRWFAVGLLDRTISSDPERTWQLLRRAARQANDWITVDDLAHPYATGIAVEPYRWAELEQLVFSSSRWERRLVGSTIATLTHGSRRAGREPKVVERSLSLLAQLMGDAEPDVQKSLAWAYRSLARIDGPATEAALRAESDRAVDNQDGHRAWVIRDALPKLEPSVADDIRTRLTGIRRRTGAPSTSDASRVAADFGSLPSPEAHPEPPLAADRPVTIAVSQERAR